MSYPKLGNLSVRITVVGRSSARWNAARDFAEAERLNQALSELRGKNIRHAVEVILQRELPNVSIAPSSSGVGSSQPVEPEGRWDNEAINRSVIVKVDLTSSIPSIQLKSRPPTRISVLSKIWTVKVISLEITALAWAFGRLRIVLRNPYSGKEMAASANLNLGGGLSASRKGIINTKVGTYGKEVNFEMKEAMGFDDFRNEWVRVGKVGAKLGIGAEYTYLEFPNITTSHKPLDRGFKLGAPSLQAFASSGRLRLEGTNPGDWLEVATPADIVPVQVSNSRSDRLVLSFPTGKASLSDLTAADRMRLEEFVTNKARAIATLLPSFDLTTAQP